ncbi:MAG: Type 1 glutamine amidotransferase-like domain-containing protein [Bifidobacterium sp.]|nr:Type 1 glutamine amidotransferase-like domain-containing protein [Bifidobacterium sp.]
MRRLLLTSSFSATADRLPAFLEDSPKNHMVAFIPTANLPQRSDGYVQEARKTFTDMDCRIDDLEVSTADPETIRRSLEEDDLIYLSGGNTFFLLQELRRSGAADLIRQQVNQGKPYIGESAGAVVTGPDIGFLDAMDPRSAAPDLDSTTGLGLVDFRLLPHLDSEPFAEVTRKILDRYGDDAPMVAINNSQAVAVHGQCLTIL